ncbi:MAG: AAA family ATPase, partial [Abyssibacter sp.]|nr:AAA family ATPase [Abyssibacter sp.]
MQQRANEIIVGKQHQLKLATACLIAGGHLLIDDVPGMGKTTLAHTLARLFGLEFSRVQFTSDLLPADILGVSVFEGA